MLLSHYFEDIEIGEVEITRRRTILESDINQFANLTWDIHPIHTDKGYAQSTPFKGRIAHGYLVLSFAGALAIPTQPGPLLANYGVDRLRFVRPCRIDDSIFVEQTVIEKEDKNNGTGVITLEVKVKNQAEQDLVLLVQKVLVATRNQQD
jgi:3-hydroxybutyryl-CoA dehydratase